MTKDKRADLIVAFGSALVNVVSAQQRYKFREAWQDEDTLLAERDAAVDAFFPVFRKVVAEAVSLLA